MKRTYLNFNAIIRVIAISLLLFVFFTPDSSAAINGTINFQGKVINKTTGTNVSNGNYNFEFRLYSAASGGSLLWTETRTGGNQVTVTDGIFRVALGSVTALSGVDFNSDSLYLEIEFNGETFTSERIRFSAVPYAFNAEMVNGLTVTNTSDSSFSSATYLKIADGETINFGANSLTFTTSGDTTLTLPTSGTVTALGNTTTGSGSTLVLASNPSLAGLTLSSGGITLGASLGTSDDCLKGGTTATWGSCGGGSGANYWNLVSGNGVSSGGYITPINSTADFLLGGQSTASAKFAFTGLSNLNNQTQALISGQLIVMPNNGFGNVGIGTTNPNSILHITSSSVYNPDTNYLKFSEATDYVQLLFSSQSEEFSQLIWSVNAEEGFNFAQNGKILGFNGGNGLTLSSADILLGDSLSNIILNGGTISDINGRVDIADDLEVAGTVRAYDLVAHNLLLSDSSSSILTAVKGFDGYTNLSGGIGTSGTQRVTSTGNLVNIGSIQAGETLLTRGGTFATKVDYTAGDGARFVEVVDLNRDGKKDIAVVNYLAHTMSVLINNGDGTFATKVDYTTGTTPWEVSVGDLNGDSMPDLITANGDSDNMSIFLNNGDGTFATKVDVPTGDAPVGIAITDVNGDGKADVIITNRGVDNNVSVFINNGDATFSTRVNYAANTTPRSIASGDLNGDGWADFAVPNYNSANVSVYLNNGNGTFATKVDYTTASNPINIAIADFNGDSKNDIVTSNYVGDNISVFINNGNGTFATKVDYTASNQTNGIVAGDVTGDGKADIVVVNEGPDTAGVFINNGNGTFASQRSYPASGTTAGVGLGDVNGDGNSDIVAANFTGDSVSVLLNQSSTMFYAQASTGDIHFGGNSAGSAKFSFGTNSSNATATFSGNLVMDARPNSSLTDQQRWTRISNAAGQIASGGTTGIASVSASVVYNGSLYVGTHNPTNPNGSAEVYRYNGQTLGTWTKVSQVTAGTIAASGTSGIASVSAMTVFDGFLYVGTSKQNAAEVYRYDGNTNWTKVSNATPGTIRASGTTLIDGITSLAVYNGRLYAGTKESAKAELYRYDGGTTWSIVNTTAGTFVTTNSVAVDAITSMVTTGGYLFLGTAKTNNAADVLRYNGGVGASVFTKMNNNTSGTFTLASGSTIAAVSEVSSMISYNGNIVIGIRRGANQADILALGSGSSAGDFWQRLNSAAGTITTGGTANIDGVSALTVYNGRLYAGTYETGLAEIYRHESIGTWTRVSGGPSGKIDGSSGGTTGISGVSILQSNNVLYAMTHKYTNAAEVYQYEVYLDQSYNLTFRATPGLAGGLQPGIQQEGSIFFLASSSAIANNKSAQNGAFVFSHAITTRNGAYDVAEDYPTRDDTLEPGDLISLDTEERGFVRRSTGNGDSTVIGVYSENPALRLSQNDGVLGAKAIPVALVGRVPVKVTTENGNIKTGDFLTASSISGVAMKATKHGMVIGQAMAPYDEQGIGKVMIYVNSNTYSGKTAELFMGIDINKENYEFDIISKLKSQQSIGIISEINTDRLFAGLEVVAPRIITEELIAKTIKAEKIEGLELIVSDKISLAKSYPNTKEVLSYEDLIASAEARLQSNTASLSAQKLTIAGIDVDVDGLVTLIRLRLKGSALFEGIVNVVDTLTTNNLIVSGLSTFFGDVVFKGSTQFDRPVVFNSDAGGTAEIKKGEKYTEVKFSKEYDQVPIIQVTNQIPDITEDLYTKYIEQGVCLKDDKIEECQIRIEEQAFINIPYLITKKTTKGFVILLQKESAIDRQFGWFAITVSRNKVSINSPSLDQLLNYSSASAQQGGGD
jgi:hypothetical protein